jgi:integrase
MNLECALGKILGTAVEWGYIEDNPVRMTRLPPGETVNERYRADMLRLGAIRRSWSFPAAEARCWIGTHFLSRQLKSAAKALGFGNVNWHLLRHSNAVQALLGHSSSEITRQVYLHSLTEDRRSAVMKLETLLIGPQSDPSLGTELLLLSECAHTAGDDWSGR